MSSPQLNTINATIRDLVNVIDDVKKGRASKEDALKVVDELENQIDMMVSQLSPERITDERFNAAVKALKDISEKFKALRELIIFGRYMRAKKQVLDIQETIRHTYRLLTLIRAGAPTPLVFQVVPQFFRETEVKVPEAIVYSNPMAAQIYNILLRKGEATVDELAFQLKIDDKTRDEFNKAIAQLISTGYVKPLFTSDNKMVLRLIR
ncbi:MAG: hypothetical protein DRJ60_07085 [Thermoprotei archaeon]|nr:MAG: hypothetical protein DRJ60_07085 [Thermoprotei archaeon]